MPRYFTQPLTPRQIAEMRQRGIVTHNEAMELTKAALRSVEAEVGKTNEVASMIRAEMEKLVEDERRLRRRIAAVECAPGERAPVIELTGRRYQAGAVVAWNINGTVNFGAKSSGIEHLIDRGPQLEVPDLHMFDAFGEMSQYFITEQGRVVFEHLLMMWRYGDNRPVVEPWMRLQLQPAVPNPLALPVDLPPDDGGKFWLIGRQVFLWTGCRYMSATLPPPDREQVVRRPPPPPIQWESALEPKKAQPQPNRVAPHPDPWIGLVAAILLFVVSFTTTLVGIVNHGWDNWSTANAVVNVATAGVIGATLTRRAQRRRAAMQLGPMPDSQPDEPEDDPADELPGVTRSFQAASPCPACGWLDAHMMREPGEQDQDDAVVVRQCAQCQQEWGEK